jgi:hypothetical protein
MRRFALAITIAAGLAACLGVAADAKTTGKRKPPARMLVYAQEWSLWPSRNSLPAGKVVVQLWNRGEDAHDLRIRRLRNGQLSGATQGVAVTVSGGLHQATWKLTPGRYMLYCSMPGHYARGMHTVLVVK